MNRKVKLIWDFRGPNGFKIAEHYCIHLKEFAIAEKLDYHKIDLLELSELHTISFITINEQDMKTFREALKPHRGELA